MRHRLGKRKLSRATDQRLAMLHSIVSSLLKYGKVTVTEARAKEARSMAEKLINFAKKGDLSSYRKVAAIIRDKDVVKGLFATIKEKFGGRSGGFTRITKLGRRRGDSAPLAALELV